VIKTSNGFVSLAFSKVRGAGVRVGVTRYGKDGWGGEEMGDRHEALRWRAMLVTQTSPLARKPAE
jgi:hypothetical protein